jgi:predicted nuclease of restriction endonuclease-like RecB superfamily
MLTADLIRPRLRIHGNEISTRPISTKDLNITRTAGEVIDIFQSSCGKPRRDLEAALEEYEDVRLDYPVIRGLAKVMKGAATFVSDPPVEPSSIRAALFPLAAKQGPVSTYPDLLHPPIRDSLVAAVAEELDLATQGVENALYADLLEEQILIELGREWSPDALIHRYNLELARGLLYWASEMRITVKGGYQDLFKYLKLFKLMHTIQPLPEAGYSIIVDGPISPFVQSTLRYGGQMAKFLPGLMLCKEWTMEADIHISRSVHRKRERDDLAKPLLYRLDYRGKLHSHYTPSADFDSRLEADFTAEFEAKFGGKKRKWILSREDEIIPMGDTVMIPDFSFTHVKDGRRALLEIAGFWHPEYLRRKAWKLRQAGRRDLILVAYQGVNITQQTWRDVPGEVLMFKNKPIIKDVLAAVERCAIDPSKTL